jgi:phage protein D
MPDGNAAIFAARPAIVVDGNVVAALAGGLFGLSIRENTSGLYRCEALFGNWGPVEGATGFLYFDRRTLDFGKAFAVRLGQKTLFEGRIMALEGRFPAATPPQILVLAEDRLQDLRMTRRTRTFEDVSDSDVFKSIANEHGLTPQIDVSGPTHKCLAQVNQSDLAFVRERARAVGAEVWVRGTTLSAAARSGRRGDTVELALNAGLHEFSACADLANQRSSVTASGWNIAGKEALKHKAEASSISGELEGGDSGVSILSSALADRDDTVSHGALRTQPETQAFAESWFRARARRFVTGRGFADADARIRVGATVDLRGVGALFGGKYYVSEVIHQFDSARGFRTEFTVERPALSRA